MSNDLPDIQSTPPKIKIPIQQVGVQNIELPFMLESKYGGFYHLVANVSMGTNLDQNTKGISMSRLIRTLIPYLDLPLKHKLIKEILTELQTNIGSPRSFMKFEFRLPMSRKSPISNQKFPIFYKCRFEGHLDLVEWTSPAKKKLLTTKFRFFQGIRIQYASYCPCSAELCHDLECKEDKGYPHNQRSFADILIETKHDTSIWLEDIIEKIEEQLKTLPYPIIKREDEQEIARIAATNPMFVEDSIREVSNVLDSMDGILDWIVKCTHEESIHTSEAIAINYKGIEGGFDERYYV
jgi:GTP cyclohydrolase I